MKKVKKLKNKVEKKIKVNGKIIKQCRELLGMTQAELAKKIKSTSVYFSKAENNRGSLPYQNKKLLAIYDLMAKKQLPIPIQFMRIIDKIKENE
jgi:transcriptional regulator with XRE-family HTH domain